MAGAACTVIAVACVAPVYAQTGDRPVRRVEVSIGGGWFGGADLGDGGRQPARQHDPGAAAAALQHPDSDGGRAVAPR